MSKTSFSKQDAGAGIMAALTVPNAPRALLVSLDRDGQLAHVPVGDAQSLVNIKDELIDHLSSYPHSDEWLVSTAVGFLTNLVSATFRPPFAAEFADYFELPLS
jgi:hypothetical protein